MLPWKCHETETFDRLVQITYLPSSGLTSSIPVSAVVIRHAKLNYMTIVWLRSLNILKLKAHISQYVHLKWLWHGIWRIWPLTFWLFCENPPTASCVTLSSKKVIFFEWDIKLMQRRQIFRLIVSLIWASIKQVWSMFNWGRDAITPVPVWLPAHGKLDTSQHEL